MYFFIGVNYGTSEILDAWFESIKNNCSQSLIYLVDNFQSSEERSKVRSICLNHGGILIESENIGYGRALNLAFEKMYNLKLTNDDVIFAGNLDIQYNSIPDFMASGKYVYLSRALEGKRNRNPFLTKAQFNVSRLQKYAHLLKSSYLQRVISLLTRVAGLIPSKPWTVHGSLFVFNASLLVEKCPIFNSESFLYCEELEFGSYIYSKGFTIVSSEVEYEHLSHAATSKLGLSRTNINPHWLLSYGNWISRWK